MKTVQTAFVLQYPMAGTVIGEYADGSFQTTHRNDADRFVAVDRQSGGYPYSVGIENAHRFASVEDTEKYCGAMNCEKFKIRQLTVTYEIK